VLKGENGWNNFSSVNVADWDVDNVMEWLTEPCFFLSSREVL
jgi:hypothetical protein